MESFPLLFLWVILVTQNINARVHDCGHDKLNIEKGSSTLHRISVPYKNHPYAIINEKNIDDRRSLLTQDQVSPIRIGAYYDSTVTSSLNAFDLNYLKEVISSTIHYYEKFVSIIPIDGTFYMERFCYQWYPFDGYKSCYNYGFTPYETCQAGSVPIEHYKTEYLYFTNNQSAIPLEGGTGIQDTDLMLYVSYGNVGICGGSTLAWAGPCAYDQYGRPLAGGINICPFFFDGQYNRKQDTVTLLHEMTHITIMSSSLWDEFRYVNGSIIPVDQVYDQTNIYYKYIISPKVKSIAESHFNCLTATGAPLSNQTSHWHQKWLFSECLTPSIWSGEQYYSDFTLALMEDSGWYLVDYDYAERFYFGKDAGCTWFSDDCVDKTSHSSNFPLYACDSGIDHGCNSGYSAPGGCGLYSYPTPVPTTFQYYTTSTIGGPESSDYCSARTVSSGADAFESVCWDERGNNATYHTKTFTSETYGLSARCVDMKNTFNSQDIGFCFNHVCYGYTGTEYAGVQIQISSTENITCLQADVGTIKVPTTISNAEITCPDVDAICGTSTKPFECYYGRWSDTANECICSPGFIGAQCDQEDTVIDTDIVLQVSLAPTPPPTPSDCVIISGYGALLDGNYTFEGIYNGWYASYERLIGTYRVIYWNVFWHEWLVADDKSGSYRCVCQVSEFTEFINDCNGYWGCGLTTTACGPTLQPTPIPTDQPTDQPTSNPTNQPTNQPTSNPTNQPTNNPTDQPTSVPTTSGPTAIPITSQPTSNPTTDSPTTSTPTKIPTTAVPSTVPITSQPTSNPTTSSPTTSIPTDVPTTSQPSGNPSGQPSSNPSINPSGQPTFIPSNNPSINPSMNPSNNPSINPSINPTDFPTNVGPTMTPTDTFYRNITIELEYINDTCIDFNINNSLSLLIGEFLNNYFQLQYSFNIDNIFLINNVNDSVLIINYQLSNTDSVNTLNDIENIIISDIFRQDLIEYIENNDDNNCFVFALISISTSEPESTILTTEDDNDEDGNNDDDGINLLDYENYNMIEYTILGGIALGILLLIVCMIWFCKRNSGDDNRRLKHSNNAHSVQMSNKHFSEFGRNLSQNRANQGFNTALHNLNSTKANAMVPDRSFPDDNDKWIEI